MLFIAQKSIASCTKIGKSSKDEDLEDPHTANNLCCFHPPELIGTILVGVMGKRNLNLGSQYMTFGKWISGMKFNLSLDARNKPIREGQEKFGIFGVCDGHGGDGAAKSASKLAFSALGWPFLRYLRVRNYNTKKAAKMLKGSIKFLVRCSLELDPVTKATS
ncbi:hypothetical protein GmHk_03G006840 [Glycine max]|nr:hypothetical protein GmHk_03G006840 [Glycine max]